MKHSRDRAVALDCDILTQAVQKPSFGVKVKRVLSFPHTRCLYRVFRPAIEMYGLHKYQPGEVLFETDSSLGMEQIGQLRAGLPAGDENAVGVLCPASPAVEAHLLDARGCLQDEAPPVRSGRDDLCGQDDLRRVLPGEIMGQFPAEPSGPDFLDSLLPAQSPKIVWQDAVQRGKRFPGRALKERKQIEPPLAFLKLLGQVEDHDVLEIPHVVEVDQPVLQVIDI